MEDFERMVIRAGNTVVRRESDALVIAHSKQTVASLQGPST